MDCCLDASCLASTQLDGASCLLDVIPDDVEDGLRHDATNRFTDADGADTWVLVQGDQAASCERGKGLGVYKVSAQAFREHSEGEAENSRGGMEGSAQSSPSVGV